MKWWALHIRIYRWGGKETQRPEHRQSAAYKNIYADRTDPRAPSEGDLIVESGASCRQAGTGRKCSANRTRRLLRVRKAAYGTPRDRGGVLTYRCPKSNDGAACWAAVELRPRQ